MAKIKSAFKELKIKYQDIDRQIVENNQIKSDIIDVATQSRIIAQVNEEYDAAFAFNEAKRAVALARLKLYNNQRKDSATVGDPLMFTVFNTIHAALYDDRLTAEWEGRGGEGDDDVEENLNALSTFDYDVMGKNKLDYFWNWDAEFFGRGLMLLMDFDRRPGFMCPSPEVIDAITFIRDPRATSVNGDSKGKGAMRFGGWEVGATYYELKNLPGYFNIHSLQKDKEIRSLMDEARDARATAQGNTQAPAKEESLGKYNNYEFRLLNWFTTIKGDRYLVTLGNRKGTLVRLIKLKFGNLWPVIDRSFYPMSQDWDGVTIPDLTEDKQRARALLTNLSLRAAKSEALPQYLFDQTRIKNKNDLNWRMDKFIGVDGRVDNAIQALQKSPSLHQSVSVIMELLDEASQRALAAPEIQQGVQPKTERTLGELQMVSSKVDTRYSMSAKVYGWSEQEFWRQWYRLYKAFFKDGIDEKIVRVSGALAPIWRPLTRENIISQVDPDVKIESKVISEAKRMRLQQQFTAFAGIVMQDPENNRRFVQRKLGKLNGMTKEELDAIFPPTTDELQAEDENMLLNAEKVPKISAQDDHKTHILIHAKANQNGATLAHIRAHKRLMVVRRDRTDLFPPTQSQPFQVPGGKTIIGEKVAPPQ